MCASVSKQAVIRQLQVLLKGADLESTTEEVLHKQLSSHFRQDMGPFTDDIQVLSVLQETICAMFEPWIRIP